MGRCSVHLQSQIEEKREQGMELTEQEQEIFQADEDEVADVTPKKFGPLSDADIPH